MAYEEIDLSKIHTYLAADRVSKFDVPAEAKPYQKGMSLREFIATLPGVLKPGLSDSCCLSETKHP